MLSSAVQRITSVSKPVQHVLIISRSYLSDKTTHYVVKTGSKYLERVGHDQGSKYAFGLHPSLFSRTSSLNFKRRDFSTTCTNQKPTVEATEVKSQSQLLSLRPEEFEEFLRSHQIKRFYAVWDEKLSKVVVSHPALEPLGEWLNDPENKHFQQHEAIFMQLGIRTGRLLGAFLWNTHRGEACGGIRMTKFSTVKEFVGDGLRLSVRLGRKAALAGLWMGGGKGLIPEDPDKQHVNPEYRQKLFWDYGDFVSSLNGCYVAGTDVGVNTQDLYNVHSRTRWAVCGPEDIGGCGNAFQLLGRGVICAMEAALTYLNFGTFQGINVVIEGAGGIAFQLASNLLDAGVGSIYITETNQKRIDDIKDMIGRKSNGRLFVEKVPIGDHSILSRQCDILSPCAVGHVLTKESIPKINAKIICGPANAQLKEEDDCKLLDQKGISFVVESLANRMAIVTSAYEAHGRIPLDPAINKHFSKDWEHSIFVMTLRVLREASEKNITPVEAANILASEFTSHLHPLWPNRSKDIIKALVQNGWHEGNDFWRRRHNFATTYGCA